ncbi:hypothetical protein [Intestinibacter sp.]|uniref:hypothetical protein n=1 Tax=Intestinibacter sp. TaxID=1965304 RepID=UPI003F18ADA0
MVNLSVCNNTFGYSNLKHAFPSKIFANNPLLTNCNRCFIGNAFTTLPLDFPTELFKDKTNLVDCSYFLCQNGSLTTGGNQLDIQPLF